MGILAIFGEKEFCATVYIDTTKAVFTVRAIGNIHTVHAFEGVVTVHAILRIIGIEAHITMF